MSKPFHTTLYAKAEVVNPSSDGFKTLASQMQNKYGIEVKPQMDLLYVRSCLVTAGEKFGINDNDDVFTREAVWAARHTPLIKPANWQHQEKDIVGVVFSVEARDLDGNLLNFNDDEVPDCEFELWTEAAIFKLVQPAYAREIEARSIANTLYVSMEAWFDDYSYALYNSDGELEELVSRDKSTAFLDSYLRAKGGSGKYKQKKIGRALNSITYGGYGFVDVPANKRSVISDVGNIVASESLDDRVFMLVKEAMSRLEIVDSKEESLMNVNASKADVADVKEQVREVLSEQAAAQKAEADQKALVDRAIAAENKIVVLEKQVIDLEAALADKNASQEALKAQMAELDTVVEALAGATSSTPSEIAAIDAASDGASAYTAKIAWIGKSVASLADKALLADTLQVQVAEAARTARIAEVKNMFAEAGVTNEKIVSAYVDHASDLSDDEYQSWKAQSELLIYALAAKPEEKKAMPFAQKKKKTDEQCAKSADNFVTLTQALKEEGAGINSGVTPSAPGLSTPRFKIAGSASDDDLADSLDNVQADTDVNLAGASHSADEQGNVSEVRNAFRAAANLAVYGTEKPNKDEVVVRNIPSFDPIK